MTQVSGASLHETTGRTMSALQKTAAAPGVSLREVERPRRPGPGEVLIQTEATGICGTDVHIAAWTPGYESMERAMPVTLGHELSGIIAAAGPDLPGDLIGRRVTVRPSVVCHECAACLAGDADNCTNRRGIGVGRDGGFAPELIAPFENCVAVPDGIDAELAALTEPLTVCREAADTAGIRPGARVLVLGPGTIGQGIALFAEAAGAALVVVAGHDDAERLEAVRGLGFRDVVDTRGQSLAEALAPWLTQGRFDAVIEATGVPSVVEAAMPLLAKRGTMVIAGIHPAPARIDLTALVRAHQQIRGSYRAPETTWPEVLAYVAANAERVRQLISHRLPLAEAERGIALARSRQASKIMIVHTPEENHHAVAG